MNRFVAGALASLVTPLLFTSCGPCVFVSDQKACDAAYLNAPRLPKLTIGMTPDEVKHTLGGADPQRREASTSGESWYFMSDYERELMTKLTFENGRLTRIETVSWESK